MRKKVTGFSNEEEKLAGLDKSVPFLTETELVNREPSIRRQMSLGRHLLLRIGDSSLGRIRHRVVPSLTCYSRP